MKIIAISNIKGGTGKSTISANLITALSENGHKVFAIDIDNPQYTLHNYFKNRSDALKNKFEYIKLDNIDNLQQVISENQHYDYIIIDTPGNINDSTKKLYGFIDIFLTPVSDSRLDLDVIGQFDPKDEKFTPGCYASMIWEVRKHKLINKRKQLEWIVIPNKLNVRVTNNQRKVLLLLQKMQKTLGFTLCPGVKDRVVFKELFNNGRTVFDLPKSKLTISSIAAKNEIRSIVFKLNSMNN
ncbi:division plane positioning ATPase MipZ [Candidatus Cytomitobacter primus]|uniref:AAA family ATPase n=1 Tax=Candidatus Cytomitobacter primus TaxID=2066024 RepID=A0A5C0UF41_9PROT|nr:division plane positioning ATPase MipZ [Candidatus Cytomitobacter primus]QEK38330.1 AAA family ATPase [Candidatus Cytomitobacter primus]